MKKVTSILCVLLLLSAFLFGCGQSKGDPQAEELCFPGLNWNMTPEQAIKALKLSKGDYTETIIKNNGDLDSYTISVEHYEIFGTDAAIGFQFHDYDGNGIYHLQRINMGFSANENMEAVEAEIMKVYGEGQPVYETGRDWESGTPCRQFLTEEQVEYLSCIFRLKNIPDDPVTQIQLRKNAIVDYSYYEGEKTNNCIYFVSEYSHITQEGGYPVP